MDSPVFRNPLLPSPSQDPWITFHHGEFLALNTDGQRIYLRRSREILRLFEEGPTLLWTAPRRGPCSRHLWAPELHRIADGWFIYFAADDGRNANHRVWALSTAVDDPAGPYALGGRLETGGWAIDATLLHGAAGERYVVWSGWAQEGVTAQNLYIAPLADPLTLAGPRTLLCRPTQRWEIHGARVCEGPAVLRRDGVTCIVYSAGASWTVRSCLGMLVHRGGDYLDPGAWRRTGPVFTSTPEVWGVGHPSFTHDPASGTDLIFYHAKTRRRRGWRDRNIRAQAFGWTADGLPHFGLPAPVEGD